MSDSDIVTAINDLSSLQPDIHWFCPRESPDDEHSVFYDEDLDDSDEEDTKEAEVRRKKLEDAANRKLKFLQAVRIIAYDGEAAAPFQDTLKSCLKDQLARCNICVRQYHRCRSRLRQELESEYDRDTTVAFMDRFDQLNIDRITSGLNLAKQTLLAMPLEKRKINNLEGPALFSLFETMHCIPLLKNDQLLTEAFDEPFRLAQPRRRIFLPDYTPAHTAFIFGPNNERLQWALFNWSKMTRDVSGPEFDWDVKDLLSEAMSRVQITSLEKDFMPQFWRGISTLMKKLNQNVIAHHMRGMEFDLCKLALEHLQVDSPAFHDLLVSLCAYMTIAPREFWDALGSINAQSVVEQVFNSPNLESIAQESGAGDTQELEEALSWVLPFVKSMRPGNLPPACRSLLHHLWTRHRSQAYPGVARKVFYVAGLHVLGEALAICHRAGLSSGTAIADLITLLQPHIPEIVNHVDQEKVQVDEVFSASLAVITNAVAADVVLLASDRHAVVNQRALAPDSNASSTALLQSVVHNIGPKDPALVKAVLEGFYKLIVVSKLSESHIKKAPQESAAWTARLIDRHNLLRDLLERIQDFEDDFLADLAHSQGAMVGFLALLFSGDRDTQQSAATTLRSLTGESSRRDAITYTLRKHYEPTLRALCDVLRTITHAQVFQPSLVVIKVGTDFVQALCDSQDGILGSMRLNTTDVAQTEVTWKQYWTTIKMIFDTTEQWSLMGHDKSMMVEFCRDAMDFASQTFDVYSVISGALHSSSNGDDARIEMDRRLLEAPTETTGSIAKWLRLRDEYLLTKAVDLICKVMGRLQDVDLGMPAASLEFISDIVHDEIRNKVPSGLKAQLRKALDIHLDEALGDKNDIETNSFRKQGLLTGWVSSGSSSRPTTRPTAKTQAIDIKAWQAAAAHRKNFHADGESESVLKKMSASAATTQDRLKSSGLSARLPIEQSKRPPPQTDSAKRNEFLKKRQEALEAKRKRDQAAIAEANKSRAGIANAGSGLAGIGVEGKDHSAKGQGVMVSSDESSDDDDDDGELDAELFGAAAKHVKRKDTVKQDAAGAVGLKREVRPTKIMRQVRSKKDMRARLQPDLGPLHKIILSWDFFHKDDYPPNSGNMQFRKVSNSFQHVEDYKGVFQPLLTLEAWQGVVRAREEDSSRAYEIKISNRMSVDTFVEISTSVTQAELRDLQLSEGDIILLSTSNKPTTAPDAPHCLARVHGIKRKNKLMEVMYKVVPNNPLISTLTTGAVVHAAKVHSIIPLEREYGAIAGLAFYDLCDEIVKARPSPLLNYTDKQLDPVISNYNVNKAQAKAIKSALDNDAFTLIQGPPGSGKTKTIVAIVGALLTDSVWNQSGATRIHVPGTASSDGMSRKLLVCAPSNAAVDELVMRLKEGVKTTRGSLKKINVLRLGRSEAINSAVVDVTLDELVNKRLGATNGGNSSRDRTQALKQEHIKVTTAYRSLREQLDNQEIKGEHRSKLQDELNQVKRRQVELGNQIDNAKDAENAAGRTAELEKKRVQQLVIDESHVICATLSGSGHELFQSLSVEFETVVVDEAAQCVEMSALIPLKYGCAKCILVGDPKQLPPTVFSKEAARFQYEQSLFVRMQGNHPDAVHLLDTQYRMHPHISSFPSATFYDGRLLDGPGMEILRNRTWHMSSLLAPYRFFDVQGQHSAAPKGHSLVNVAEIDIALLLYERLTSDFGDYDFTNKIGIITPYKSQLRQLKETFSRRHGQDILERIEFNTTDAFQGRESEIIIFSCVRASPAGGIGFLQDIRRMNVGLTRAKCSLWVLGNSDSLSRGQYWAKLIDDAKSRKLHTTGDLKGMLRQPSSRFKVKEQPPIKIETQPTIASNGSDPRLQDLVVKIKEEQKVNGTIEPKGMKVIDSKPSNLAIFSSNSGLQRRESKGKEQDTKDGMKPVKHEPRQDTLSGAAQQSSRSATPVSRHSRDGTPASMASDRSRPPKSLQTGPNANGGVHRDPQHQQHQQQQQQKRKAAANVFLPKKKR